MRRSPGSNVRDRFPRPLQDQSGGRRRDRAVPSVRGRRQGDSAAITRGDTMHGIPEAHLDRVFAPFFTTRALGQGTGLGLCHLRRPRQSPRHHHDVKRGRPWDDFYDILAVPVDDPPPGGCPRPSGDTLGLKSGVHPPSMPPRTMVFGRSGKIPSCNNESLLPESGNVIPTGDSQDAEMLGPRPGRCGRVLPPQSTRSGRAPDGPHLVSVDPIDAEMVADRLPAA